MSKNNIYINCSELASFIGQNKWDYLTPFIRLWKRVDKNDYMLCENNSDLKIIDKKEELNNTLGEEYITKIINSKKNIRENVQESCNHIENLDLDNNKKEELKNNIENLINTNFGTTNEYGALEIYELKNNVKLNKTQVYTSVKCHETDKNIWFVGGKVDGLLDTSKIVEVKTRTRCFFKDVRDYENTQMQMYMHIYNIDKTDLVEYLPNNKIKIKITGIKKDEKYIKSLLEKITIFTKNFEDFISSSLENKVAFYAMNDSDKKEFLSKLYINKMYL